MILLIVPSKRRLRYVYGRWTELLRGTDVASYELYKAANPAKFGSESCSFTSSL